MAGGEGEEVREGVGRQAEVFAVLLRFLEEGETSGGPGTLVEGATVEEEVSVAGLAVGWGEAEPSGDEVALDAGGVDVDGETLVGVAT